MYDHTIYCPMFRTLARKLFAIEKTHRKQLMTAAEVDVLGKCAKQMLGPFTFPLQIANYCIIHRTAETGIIVEFNGKAKPAGGRRRK